MAVVLITGCSSGFGRSAAVGFAAAGHTVVATMRNLATAPGLVDEAKAAGVELHVTQLDVTDAVSRERAVAETRDRFGRIDVVVNNAAAIALGPVELTSDVVVRLLFETNLYGPLELMRLVLPIMRDQGQGRIVNVTSGAALGGPPYMGAYAATKHALDGLTASLDLEVAPFGVRAVTVVPGSFMTQVETNTIRSEPAEPYGDAHLKMFARMKTIAQDRTDFAVVTEALIRAATDPEPRFVTLAGPDLVESVGPTADAKEAFHARLVRPSRRAGLVPAVSPPDV